MSTNERSELTQFQGNSDGKSKCETKFTLAEEKKKREEEKQKQNEIRDKLIKRRLRKTKIKDNLFSYEELCDIFCSEPTRSMDSRKSQFKDWERFCDIEKVGRKYHLSNIKKDPPPDLHKSEVKQHIANVLYLYMYLHPDSKREDGRITLSRRELYWILGYVNSNYFTNSNELKYIRQNYPTIWTEYNAKLIGYMNAQIASAFSTLRNKRIIDELDGYQFWLEGRDGWIAVNDDTNSDKIAQLLSCEKMVLEQMAAENYNEQLKKWNECESPNKGQWKPERRTFDMGYIFATGQYEIFKRRTCELYKRHFKLALRDYRRVYKVYVLRHYLGEQLKENLGEEFVEDAQKLFREEQIKINQKTTVKNLESKHRLAAERENMDDLQLRILDNGSGFRKVTVFKREQRKYDEVLNKCPEALLQIGMEKEKMITDKYIEIFKDITEKLVKIYPTKL